jgi:hypothetical protein
MKVVKEVLKLNGSHVLVTYEQMSFDSKLIIAPTDFPSPLQKVVKVGHHCNLVEEGDEVFVKFENYIKVYGASGDSLRGNIEGVKKETRLEVPLFKIGNKVLALINETDIVAVVKTAEETKEEKEARTKEMEEYVAKKMEAAPYNDGYKAKVNKKKSNLVLPDTAETSKKIVVPKGNVSVKDIK